MLRKYQSHMQRIDRNINRMSARKAETQRNLEQAEDLIARAEKRLGE
jgi:predicted  nucleic acid-binding Zn-ribbon protein